MTTKSTTTSSLSTASTTTSLESATVTALKTGDYEVIGGDAGTGPIEARIISSVGGKFYSDTRLENGTIRIDMTKEIQYT